MDLQSENSTLEMSSPPSFGLQNYTIDWKAQRTQMIQDNKGEYSRPPAKNQAFTDSTIENVIAKYTDAKRAKKFQQYNNLNLNINNVEEGEPIEGYVEFTHSIQNFSHDCVNHKHFTVPSKTDNHISLVNDNAMKFYRTHDNNLPKVTFQDRNYLIHEGIDLNKKSGLTSNDKLYSDKTTYCRPVLSLYNEQFIYKTMERNSKLRRLVKKLAISRQREKENVGWNNFINELKNKHGLDCEETLQSQREFEQYITPDVIDDFYNTRFNAQKSKLCRNLLQDFYGAHDASQSICTNRRTREHSKSQSYTTPNSPYKTDSYCYPTSSQGRLIMLGKEGQKKHYLDQWYNHYSKNYFKLENKYSENKYHQRNLVAKVNMNSSAIQTDNKTLPDFRENVFKNKATNNMDIFSKNELVQTINNDKNPRENKQDIAKYLKSTSLFNIENKLETLTNSINNLIEEIKSSRKPKQPLQCASVTCNMNNETNKSLNLTKSETVGENVNNIARTEKFVCGMRNDSSGSTITVSNFYPTKLQKSSKIHEILGEVENFSLKDKVYKSKPCSVQITFEVPTKDCSTEVTKSLSKQNVEGKIQIIEEIRTPDPTAIHQMTIAVNTDPFNLLSLLSISTEILKRFLSYVPNIDCHSYLSMLHFPQTTRKIESNYICNICGVQFNKPSQLSDHIQEHNLGKTRDCCVCRHALDMSRKSLNLFRCQFCGQRFTRAYCCELHQQCCARRLGRRHDVTSSLILLR